ncbi:MAG: DNA-binding domain-containing protein [Alphaproteobacteria bacterium]|nr:DNA-binding domain-containing protein [Alphaproteobacteria bacterium]
MAEPLAEIDDASFAALAEFQAAFFAVLREDATHLRGAFTVRDDPPLSAQRRLQVHYHHHYISLTDALMATYAALEPLVGAEFLEGAARAYVQVQPPQQAWLSAYGDGFGAFLAGFPPAQSLPYLPDTARLIWALHHAACASDEGASLLASPYAVDEVLDACMAARGGDAQAAEAIAAGLVIEAPCCLLVCRDAAQRLLVRSLSAGEYAARMRMAAGHGGV